MSHVPSQPWRIPSPKEMIRSDSGLPHNTRNLMGTSGYIFEDPPAPEGPSPSFLTALRNLISPCELRSGNTESALRHGEGLRREPQSSTIPTPRFTRTYETWNPSYHIGGTYSQNGMMETPRNTISELHVGKFPDTNNFQCWRVDFKTEVCGLTLSLTHNVLGQRSGDGKINRRFYDVAIR